MEVGGDRSRRDHVRRRFGERITLGEMTGIGGWARGEVFSGLKISVYKDLDLERGPVF